MSNSSGSTCSNYLQPNTCFCHYYTSYWDCVWVSKINGGTHPLLNIQDVHMAGQQAMLLSTPIQDSSVQVHHGEGVAYTGRRWSASGVWWWPCPWEESNQQMEILHPVSVRHRRALTAKYVPFTHMNFVWTYVYPPLIVMSTSSVSGAISLFSTSYKELHFALPSSRSPPASR